MTIEERQGAAETWANAYLEWQEADEAASHADQKRVEATIRLEAAREKLEGVAAVSSGTVPTRVFVISRDRMGSEALRLVKVTYGGKLPGQTRVELLRTEPRE